MALLFTVATFWWLNARLGGLKSWEPQTYALSLSEQFVRIRLPLVMYNTGARPIVVLDMRLRFLKETEVLWPMRWTGTAEELMPKPDDEVVAPAGFAIAGRTAEQLIVGFTVPSPGVVPESRDYRVVIEAVLGHKKFWQRILRPGKRWQPFVRFTLRIGHTQYSGSYVAYTNAPIDLEPEHLRVPAEAMQRLAVRLREASRRSN
jgi:hypothetical protein